MFRGELRKLFQRSATRILLLILLATNGFLVWNQALPGSLPYYRMEAKHILSLYRALPQDAAQAWDALEQQRAAMTEEWTAELLTRDIYTERTLFSAVMNRVEPIARYHAILEEIDENADTLLSTGRYASDSFGYGNIVTSRETYRALRDVQPQMLYSGAVELLAGGRLTDLILLLCCILVGLELLTAERVNGTMALIKPTCKGRYPFMGKKILAGIFMAFLGTCVLYGSNLAIGFVRCGGLPLNVPVQSIFGFVRSPWHISIGAYLLGFFAMKALWAVTVTAMVYLACCMGRSVLECCGIFLLFAVLGMKGLATGGDTVGLFAEYRNLNLFGEPVSLFVVSTAGMIAVSGLCFGLASVLHARTALKLPRRKGRKTHKIGRVSTNLLLYEARKLFLLNGALWVLVGLLAVQTVAYLQFDAYIGPQEKVYMQYSKHLAGAPNAEKDAFLAEEAARFAGLYAQRDEYYAAVSKGELKQEACEALCAAIQAQLEGEEPFLRAQRQYEQMKQGGYDYVCQSGYERLLGSEGKADALGLAVKLMLALSLGLSSVHSMETESQTVLLLNTVPCKEESRKRKSLLVTVYAVAAAVLTFTPHVLSIAEEYGLHGMLSHGNSVQLLKLGLPTILAELCIYGAVISGLAVLAAHGIAWISRKTGNTTATVLLSSAWIPLLLLL